ncbi:hypothetical protein [Antarcticirhabdus aurantiaca]|uniref:Uncharacterized protein n=1 Tax=Antarcticirhabdus aurantiaca TaxID=2606717 RepID=A0ACD4NHZ8_9HYPH|nr:hypothetical protein [Antarcticirhabdus aurantiaca]WAJ26463.1 hypothetical protein OXU80_16435 [Jeongeuplla avenae]
MFLAVFATATLSACSAQRPPEGFDFRARPPAVREGDTCQRYAFETGRRRYELLQQIQGDAFAALLANRAAERAFARCRAGRAG